MYHVKNAIFGFVLLAVFLILNTVARYYTDDKQSEDLYAYFKSHRAIHCTTGILEIWETEQNGQRHIYNVVDSNDKAWKCKEVVAE